MKDKKHRKVKDHYHYAGEYRGAGHSICNSKFILPSKFAIVLHNGSNYDFHFIIKELIEEFKRLKNTEKCITFTVQIEKEITKFDRNGEEMTKKYILHVTVY